MNNNNIIKGLNEKLILENLGLAYNCENIESLNKLTNKQFKNKVFKSYKIKIDANNLEKLKQENLKNYLDLTKIKIKVYSIKNNKGFHWEHKTKIYKDLKVENTQDGNTCWNERDGIKTALLDDIENNFFGLLVFDNDNNLIARAWLFNNANEKIKIIFNCYSNDETITARVIGNTLAKKTNKKIYKIGLYSMSDDNYFYINNDSGFIIDDSTIIRSEYTLYYNAFSDILGSTCCGYDYTQSDIDNDIVIYSDWQDAYILNDNSILAYDSAGREQYVCNECTPTYACPHCNEYIIKD